MVVPTPHKLRLKNRPYKCPNPAGLLPSLSVKGDSTYTHTPCQLRYMGYFVLQRCLNFSPVQYMHHYHACPPQTLTPPSPKNVEKGNASTQSRRKLTDNLLMYRLAIQMTRRKAGETTSIDPTIPAFLARSYHTAARSATRRCETAKIFPRSYWAGDARPLSPAPLPPADTLTPVSSTCGDTSVVLANTPPPAPSNTT